MEGREWLNMGIIAISVVVVASVLFGIVFGVPLWYAYALRCAIFAVLGYWFAKKEPLKNILPKSNKILSYVLLIAGFTLAFLFVFGLIFVVRDLAGTTLSSVIPFAIANGASSGAFLKGYGKNIGCRQDSSVSKE